MAKDDYHVIVYRILAYLYAVLKSGIEIEESFLQSDFLQIPRDYWLYVLSHLIKDGFIENLCIYQQIYGISDLQIKSIQITPLGIEYLQNHSTMQQAKESLKEIKEIVPFV